MLNLSPPSICNPNHINKPWVRILFFITTLLTSLFTANIINDLFQIFIRKNTEVFNDGGINLLLFSMDRESLIILGQIISVIFFVYAIFVSYKLIRKSVQWYKHAGYIHLLLGSFIFGYPILIYNILRIIKNPDRIERILSRMLFDFMTVDLVLLVLFVASYMLIKYKPSIR